MSVVPARSNAEVVKAHYQAYVDNDRAAAERLTAADFRFTSPLDNGLDRATYFAHCWPNSETMAGFDFIRIVEDGVQVWVTYDARTSDGRRFRNTEVLTVRDGKVAEAEVYFGWNVPHKAPPGGFLEASGER